MRFTAWLTFNGPANLLSPGGAASCPARCSRDLKQQHGDTRADFAGVGIGVAVRAGAPQPDISSVDAFKRVMVNAKSITYPPEGATGVHLVRVFERLGIAEQMKAKTKPQQDASYLLSDVQRSGENGARERPKA